MHAQTTGDKYSKAGCTLNSQGPDGTSGDPGSTGTVGRMVSKTFTNTKTVVLEASTNWKNEISEGQSIRFTKAKSHIGQVLFSCATCWIWNKDCFCGAEQNSDFNNNLG